MLGNDGLFNNKYDSGIEDEDDIEDDVDIEDDIATRKVTDGSISMDRPLQNATKFLNDEAMMKFLNEPLTKRGEYLHILLTKITC